MTNLHKHLDKTTKKQNLNNLRILNEWRNINVHIKGQPNNYQAHSKRILFALNAGLNQFLAGSLQDLFIALGTTGRPLRSRMYSLVLPLIDQHDREYFQEWLLHDSDETLGCYRALGAVLTSHTCQKSKLEPDPFTAQVTGTTIDQSRHAIAHGRIEEAQAQLTQAINQFDVKPDVTLVEELLNILAATRQKDELAIFTRNLEKQKFILSTHWKHVLESSKAW